MHTNPTHMVWRLMPVILLTTAAALWIYHIQEGGPYALGNLIPLAILLLLAALTLYRGRGTWSGAGMSLPLATLGFSIPALGLSLYLHYAYSTNLNDMFTDAEHPDRVFRYLPVYTIVAGGIGFAIGWIVGRNV